MATQPAERPRVLLKPGVFLKNVLRAAAYRAGGQRALARLLDSTLTVILFHRVLPDSDPRAATADRAYTMRLPVFEACAEFLARSYTPISLQRVQDALDGGAALPPRALLVTFDDGWDDTGRYAAPALAARGIPSVLFVATDGLTNDHALWRDAAAILFRASVLVPPDQSLNGLYAWLEAMPEHERMSRLAEAYAKAGADVRPLMLSREGLRALSPHMALGGHGASHTPLPLLSDPATDLDACRRALAEATGAVPSAFAFPHGLYGRRDIEAAYAAGYSALFTSDPLINRLRDGRPVSPVLGRIAPSEADITDHRGRFSASRAAFFLMRRRIGALDPRLGSQSA